MITLGVTGTDGAVLAQAQGADEAWLVHRAAWETGGCITLDSDPGAFVVLTVAAAVAPALLFLPDGQFSFPVPQGAAAAAYAPQAFGQSPHRIQVRRATAAEIATRRDLARNPCDHAASRAFPHARASVETRSEACFAARCAIDGERANEDHGFWPYTSWGIAQDPAARLDIAFGRPVVIDEIILTLRADFPHDSWWTSATVWFDDGSDVVLALARTGARQGLTITPRRVTRLTLGNMVRADDPSPFPALTRIEVMGTEGEDR